MTKKIFGLKMLAMVLVFGMLVVGSLSAQADRRLNGTWSNGDVSIMFDNGNFEIIFRIGHFRGVYNTSATDLTMIVTHINAGMDDGGMYRRLGVAPDVFLTKNEFLDGYRTYFERRGFSAREIRVEISVLSELLLDYFFTETTTFVISGDTLAFSGGMELNRLILTRR